MISFSWILPLSSYYLYTIIPQCLANLIKILSRELRMIQFFVHTFLRSSSCVPCSTISPSRSTRIMSASRIVESRWAITKDVSSLHHPKHGFLKPSLKSGVHRGCRLVQNQNLRILQNRSCDGKELFFSLRNIVRFLIDQ